MGNEMTERPEAPQREKIGDVLKKYKEQHGTGTVAPSPQNNQRPIQELDEIERKVVADSLPHSTPSTNYNPQNFEETMSKETDPDLMTSYEIVKLPSKGLYYESRISEVNVEYMTSKDEDLLTTPSLIENGTVLDVLLKRKIKTRGLNIDDLLAGDRNAIILFLRSSSYGSNYSVQVPDPRTNVVFNTVVDLMKLKYKEVTEIPDSFGCFEVKLPMRNKTVKFKLLSSGEENNLFKNSEAIKEAYSQEFSTFNTMKLVSHIVSIEGKTDRSYISKFVDAMPALDALTIRRKILDVSPDVNMDYEFTAKDGYKFTTQLSVGIDFFFPNT